jgi:hypothetical protein
MAAQVSIRRAGQGDGSGRSGGFKESGGESELNPNPMPSKLCEYVIVRNLNSSGEARKSNMRVDFVTYSFVSVDRFSVS